MAIGWIFAERESVSAGDYHTLRQWMLGLEAQTDWPEWVESEVDQ